MKIIKYATASKRGFEQFETEIEQRKHMKGLHKVGILPVPCVLVEGIPGEAAAKWLELNKYKKLIKGGKNGISEN